MAVLLLLGGLALAIWGGYTVYKRTTAKKKNGPPVENKDEQVLVKHSALVQKDSTIVPQQVVTASAGNYKFVLETSNAQRAFSRFSRLRTFQWDVKIETKDSVAFKIFMLLPATTADTTRILDSLSRLNGKRVHIEQ